jgi:hypothetical protein
LGRQQTKDDALFNLSKEGNKTVISSDAAAALKADLEEQGMSSPFELFALELSVFLGRPVGESEVSGGTYRAPPSTMAGAVAARKGGSTQTFDTVLAAAQKTGDTVDCAGNLWAPQGDKPLRCSVDECADAIGEDAAGARDEDRD